jgi:hypothetical protein
MSCPISVFYPSRLPHSVVINSSSGKQTDYSTHLPACHSRLAAYLLCSCIDRVITRVKMSRLRDQMWAFTVCAVLAWVIGIEPLINTAHLFTRMVRWVLARREKQMRWFGSNEWKCLELVVRLCTQIGLTFTCILSGALVAYGFQLGEPWPPVYNAQQTFSILRDRFLQRIIPHFSLVDYEMLVVDGFCCPIFGLLFVVCLANGICLAAIPWDLYYWCSSALAYLTLCVFRHDLLSIRSFFRPLAHAFM